MATQKTIAFVSDAIYPYNKGGKETRLFEITTRLAKRGYDVHIYCMKWWPGIVNRIENGVHLHGISPHIPLYDGPRRSIKQGIIFGLACLKLITAKFDVIDVDHMPFFPIYSVRLVCWLRRKRMVGTWNEVWGEAYWNEYLGGIKGKIASLIEKISCKLPDHILAISSLTSERLISSLSIPKNKIYVVPCGFDEDIINDSPLSSLSSDVIFVGRLLKHKNVDVLIQAVHQLKQENRMIICRIVGSGPEANTLKKLASSLGLENNVIFHGRLESHKEIFSLMKSSKVFVLPSTREGFGIVVLEANACSLPVITTNHQDNAAQLLAQKITLLDHESIAQVIKEVLKSGKDYKKSIQANLEKYSWTSVVDQIEKVYES